MIDDFNITCWSYHTSTTWAHGCHTIKQIVMCFHLYWNVPCRPHIMNKSEIMLRVINYAACIRNSSLKYRIKLLMTWNITILSATLVPYVPYVCPWIMNSYPISKTQRVIMFCMYRMLPILIYQCIHHLQCMRCCLWNLYIWAKYSIVKSINNN